LLYLFLPKITLELSITESEEELKILVSQ
jgi:hypothetical protein